MTAWRNPGRPIILASQSTRRKEILRLLGFTFDIRAPDAINEASFIGNDDLDLALRRLAIAKAESVAGCRPDALVLGADTVVVKGSRVLGKPQNPREARAMLASLAGSTHRVVTGIALVCRECGFFRTGSAVTEVRFRDLAFSEIDEYLERDEYHDKAGAYAIQGWAMAFVDGIRGCYYNVVGLPVSETVRLFMEFIRFTGVIDNGT
jgi:septum formation protein